MGAAHREPKLPQVARVGGRRLWAAFATRWASLLMAGGLVSAVAVGGFLVVRQAHAATLNVCASGCTYKSINDALAAAASGDTIHVGPGTYGPNEPGATTTDSQITISKPVTLQGAGAGHSILNTASAYSGTTASGGVVSVSNPHGNVNISGFTFEGARVNDPDPNADGILMVVSDPTASDVVTISNNLFYDDNVIDPGILDDQVDALYISSTAATVNESGNTFQGVFRGNLIEASTGTMNISGNDFKALSPNYDPTTTPATLYMSEGIFVALDGNVSSTNAESIAGNTFESYAGQGVSVVAGFAGQIGAISNVAITSNVFNLQGIAGPYYDSPAVWLRANNTSSPSLTSTISNATVQNNTIILSSTTGHGFGIWLRGNLGSGINVNHNVVRGSGSSVPAAGINFTSTVNTPHVAITNNIVSGFVSGLQADALASQAVVTVHQNCIVGNTSFGASNGAGAAISAEQNYWGGTHGPHNATSNPTGTGNAVSDNITFTPYLSGPAAVCAGPVASNLAAGPSPVLTNTSFTFSATLSDATTGNFAIASAQYSVDGGAYSPMSAQDGSFDQVAENVTVHVAGLATATTHMLCVRGTDAASNLGAATCLAVTPVLAVPGQDVMGSSTGGSPSGADASGSANGPTTQTAGGVPGGAVSQPARPTSAVRPLSDAGSNWTALLGIAIGLLVLGLGGLGIVLFRSARRQRAA